MKDQSCTTHIMDYLWFMDGFMVYGFIGLYYGWSGLVHGWLHCPWRTLHDPWNQNCSCYTNNYKTLDPEQPPPSVPILYNTFTDTRGSLILRADFVDSFWIHFPAFNKSPVLTDYRSHILCQNEPYIVILIFRATIVDCSKYCWRASRWHHMS